MRLVASQSKRREHAVEQVRGKINRRCCDAKRSCASLAALKQPQPLHTAHLSFSVGVSWVSDLLYPDSILKVTLESPGCFLQKLQLGPGSLAALWSTFLTSFYSSNKTSCARTLSHLGFHYLHIGDTFPPSLGKLFFSHNHNCDSCWCCIVFSNTKILNT